MFMRQYKAPLDWKMINVTPISIIGQEFQVVIGPFVVLHYGTSYSRTYLGKFVSYPKSHLYIKDSQLNKRYCLSSLPTLYDNLFSVYDTEKSLDIVYFYF